MLSFSIAARFLRHNSIQSLLIIAGIAVGIGVQVFLGSLIASLQQDLIATTIGDRAQVSILPARDGGFIAYTPALRAVLEAQPEVTTQVPVREFSALLRVGRASTPLAFTAGSLPELETIYRLNERAVSGKPRLSENEIIVGSDLAEQYDLQAGRRSTLVLADGSSLPVTIAAIVDLGSRAANTSTAFASPAVAGRALGLRDAQVTAVQVQLNDVFASTAVAEKLRAQAAVKGMNVGEWQADNRDLLDGLRAQGASSYTVQFFVLLAVALGIASTLAISALQKTRQIGILKAMGMGDRAAGLVFVWQAALLGVIGAAAGVIVGFALMALFAAADGSFATHVQWGFTALSFVVGVAVALLSSLISSLRTSRLDPIEVIQGG